MADFEYTYSAPEQAEIRRIREKYAPKEESTLDKLRRLDAQAEQPGTVWALVLGIVGTLIFGAGISLCLVWQMYLLGVAAGLVGLVMLAMAYPAYTMITRKQRKKIAPQILALTEELGQ